MVDRRRALQTIAAGGVAALAGCSSLLGRSTRTETRTPEKIDDWQYDPEPRSTGGGGYGGPQGTATAVASAPQATYAGAASGGTVGLAAGGGKSIATFRRNIEEGYLPLPESLSYEGLFYNYYFDTGDAGDCSATFCPRYSPAVTADPLSGEPERYLTVGLNSGLKQDEFERKTLNLVVVLDISGSMSSEFSEYYYDRYGNERTPEGETDVKKIEVAKDALVSLTEQLRPEDRLGIVLYNDDASTAKPLRKVAATDMDAIREHIREDVRAGGGTNLDAGLDLSSEMLAEYSGADQSIYENRLMVITDAMPNTGQTDDAALQDRLSRYANRNMHATVVGVGVDFNAELVDELTAVEGANYYGVHSADEFERRLGEEFKYMVTPLVYDLDLELEAEGYDIKRVYGSSAAEEATGEIMHVNTLFASPKKGGKTKGGVVLVQLERTGESARLELTANWEDRSGKRQRSVQTVQFPSGGPEQFGSSGVRKAVLLSRYADLLKNWMIYERDPERTPDAEGVAVPPADLGEWEQRSEPLTVSARYERRIREFRAYYATEADRIGDGALDREAETMATILEAA